MANKTIKTNLFNANKEMAVRVSSFARVKIWGITLGSRYNDNVKKINGQIDGLTACKGSILDDGDDLDSKIKVLQDQLVTLHEEYINQKKEDATFTYTDSDNDFYKAYKKATTEDETAQAMITWFANYNLSVTPDDTLIIDLMNAIGGRRKATAKTIINSGATKFTEEKRTKNDVLNIFYGLLAEKMIAAGTIKAADIPSDIRDKYAKKPKKETVKKDTPKAVAKDLSKTA